MTRMVALLLALALAMGFGATANAAREEQVAAPYLELNPEFQYAPLGGLSTFYLYWQSEPEGVHDFTIGYDDGNSDTYRCWVNCSAGEHYYQHTYPYQGWFYVVVHDHAGNLSNVVQVNVN